MVIILDAMKPIVNILKKYHISKNDTVSYGSYLAKIKPILSKPKKNHKLILVTATSPTPAGEGKTTVSIGLNDALNHLGKQSIVTLREPSMGPVFGVKGGANGGGKAQVIPKDDIDLHLTGDFHAITAANNLIAACIDNHIYWGNQLKIDLNKIIWKRVLDVNDRSLRNIEIVIDAIKKTKYYSGFDITAASELMAIFCIANNEQELIQRINNIIVAYTTNDQPVYVKDLHITGAIMKILQNALWPNAVQTLAGNLALIHGGPFANIAHGCNSLFATKTAMNISEYTITEAGFGSDLGAEKFVDIVCDNGQLNPNLIVLVTSIRSLKMHGGEDNKTNLSGNHRLVLGMNNLKQHIKNIKNFNLPFIVVINQFDTDKQTELKILKDFLEENKIQYSFTTLFKKGVSGAMDLAKKVLSLIDSKEEIKFIYKRNDKLDNKIHQIVTKCYGALGVEYSTKAQNQMKKLINTKAWVCMAKTPLTFHDNSKELITDKPFKIFIKDLILANGANFIIVMAGNIFRMPGLPKNPAACNM
ncbi:MAG: formate--tetrahydrofolate ligase [Mycoplasmataceae bacterium]|nr:formate--tetrahydrofolate ligase [Mycoplasmataceae bacterium]